MVGKPQNVHEGKRGRRLLPGPGRSPCRKTIPKAGTPSPNPWRLRPSGAGARRGACVHTSTVALAWAGQGDGRRQGFTTGHQTASRSTASAGKAQRSGHNRFQGLAKNPTRCAALPGSARTSAPTGRCTTGLTRHGPPSGLDHGYHATARPSPAPTPAATTRSRHQDRHCVGQFQRRELSRCRKLQLSEADTSYPPKKWHRQKKWRPHRRAAISESQRCRGITPLRQPPFRPLQSRLCGQRCGRRLAGPGSGGFRPAPTLPAPVPGSPAPHTEPVHSAVPRR